LREGGGAKRGDGGEERRDNSRERGTHGTHLY
jgi:hypothetical protein